MASSRPGVPDVLEAYRRTASSAAALPSGRESSMRTIQSTDSGSMFFRAANPSSSAAIASGVLPRPKYASESIW